MSQQSQELIYLATPYSHEDPDVMEERFHFACLYAGRLMRQGMNVFCPIAHTHPIAVRCEFPRGFDFWESCDRAMLERSTHFVVVTMDGWGASKGISRELEIAGELGIQIAYLNPLNPDSEEDLVNAYQGRRNRTPQESGQPEGSEDNRTDRDDRRER